MNININTLTDFGDSAVTGTFALTTVIFLLVSKQKSAAKAMAGAFLLTVFLIALGKITLYSRCHPQLAAFFDLRSPSGHSALSFAVYGTYAAIIASSQISWRKIVPYLFVAVLVLLIAASRVILGCHTVADVVVGSSIGLSVSFFMWFSFLRGRSIQCHRLSYTLAMLVMAIMLNGLHFPAESIINYLSHLIQHHTRNC